MSDVSQQAISGKRGANRERILRAALEIISAQGVDKVTHRAVAGLAKVSPGTTTYHFASREALVREAFDLYISDSEKALVAALTQRPLQSREDFVGFLGGMTTLQPEDSAFAAIEYEMVLFAARDSDMKMRVAAWSRVLDSWLSDPLERLGASRPLEGARMLVALCRGSEFEVVSRQMPLSPAQFEARINSILDLVIGPRPN